MEEKKCTSRPICQKSYADKSFSHDLYPEHDGMSTSIFTSVVRFLLFMFRLI